LRFKWAVNVLGSGIWGKTKTFSSA